MNEALSTYFTFWHVVVIFILAIIGVVAIRITFAFDVNKWLESRRKSYKTKLMNACTHVELKPIAGGIQGKVLFVSPPGTHLWQCQRCGLVRHDLERDEADELVRYYIANSDIYNKQTKRFRKLLKKSGQI